MQATRLVTTSQLRDGASGADSLSPSSPSNQHGRKKKSRKARNPAFLVRLRKPARSRPSFYVSLFAWIVCLAALVAFILSFIQQASYTGNTARWNIVIIVCWIAASAATAIFLPIGRVVAVRNQLKSIPKPYIPVKTIDVPKEVASYISTEYTRTSVIAHLSQPTATKQDGWGHPIHELDCRLPFANVTRNADYAADSPKHVLLHPCLPRSEKARKWTRYYLELLDEVRFARSEPSEKEWVRMWGTVFQIFECIVEEDKRFQRIPNRRQTVRFGGPPLPSNVSPPSTQTQALEQPTVYPPRFGEPDLWSPLQPSGLSSGLSGSGNHGQGGELLGGTLEYRALFDAARLHNAKSTHNDPNANAIATQGHAETTDIRGNTAAEERRMRSDETDTDGEIMMGMSPEVKVV